MMSDLRKLRGKKIWVYIKQGFTIEDLLEKYKCSQEELEKYMEKNFEKKSLDSVRRSLEKNSKKRGNNNTAVIVTQEEISESTLKEIQKKARQMQEKNIMVMKEKENKKDSDEMSLEKLKDRENALVTETCQQEGEHKRTLATRRTLLEKLVTEKEKILELKKIILQRQKEVDEIFTKMVEIDEKITAESEELSANKKILNEVREYIKVLGKVTLFVYENGEIKEEEAEVAEELLESDEVFDSLIHNKLVENLSVKQIRQLSKLMVLTEQMQKQGQNYDLVFESEIVQKIFEQL